MAAYDAKLRVWRGDDSGGGPFEETGSGCRHQHRACTAFDELDA